MKKLLVCLVVFLVAFNATAQDRVKGPAEVARPIDLRVQSDPGADVPPECAAFFSQKGWGGWLSGQRAIELWVEKINQDCKAQVVYSWGPLPRGIGPSYVRRNITITKGELRIDPVHSPGTNAVFTLTKSADGKDELVLAYQYRQGDRVVTNDARLQKGVIFE